MTTLTETTHAGEFIVSEANGSRSREAVTVLSGQDLAAGAVFGRVTLGAGSSAAKGTNTGNGAMGAITVGAGAKPGVSVLTIIEPAADAGAFTVEDPDGVLIGHGNVAAAFSAGGLSFTLADGATNFVAGDQFDITVAAGSEKAKEWNPANTDGSHIVAGVLWDAVDASAADKAGVGIVRDGEVNASELVWFTGAVADDKTAAAVQLAALGIITR